MGISRQPEVRDARPVVMLVDCAGGGELASVHRTLTTALRTPAILIRGEDLPSLKVSLDPATGLLEVDRQWFRPAVAWVRHATTGAILALARPPGETVLLDAATWSGFLHHLSAIAPGSLPGTTPLGPGQLADARRLGVRTPRTTVTTDVATAVRGMRTRKVVVKTPDFRPLAPDPLRWPPLLPKVVDRHEVERGVAGAGPIDGGRPVIVQEYVAHLRELRVYYLNGGLCSFEIRKPEPASLWTDPGRVTVTQVRCPPGAAAMVRTLSTAWNLRYGAFDLLLSPTDGLVFLEANPDGDWLWYERRSHWHGVSFMAAAMVREMYVRGTSPGAQTDECHVG